MSYDKIWTERQTSDRRQTVS